MRFWKSHNDGDLERELRVSRYEASDDFVHSMAKRVPRASRRRVVLKLGLAAWLSAMMLVAVASVGGVGEAAGAAGHLLRSAVPAQHVGQHPGNGSGKTALRNDDDDDDDHCDDSNGNRHSDCDEYKEEHKKCKKSEDERHDRAERGENKRHGDALRSIKSLSRNKQDAATRQENAIHSHAVNTENREHDHNHKKCRKHH